MSQRGTELWAVRLLIRRYPWTRVLSVAPDPS